MAIPATGPAPGRRAVDTGMDTPSIVSAYPFTHPFGPSDPELRRVAARGLLRRVWLLMMTLGTVQLLLADVLPDPDPRDHQAMLRGAFVFGLCSLAVALPRRLPDAVHIALPALGTALIFWLTATVTPLGGTTFFFLWPMLLAVYFLQRREAAAHGALVLAALAGGLALNPYAAAPEQMLIDTAMPMAVGLALVLALKEYATRLVEALRLAAVTDELTGLVTRGTFDDRLRRLTTDGRELAVVLVDVDHFKAVNDEHGHLAGDRVLRDLAEHLRAAARHEDVVARLGGEEFGLLLADTDLPAAVGIAERLRGAVRDAASDPGVTVSAGVAVARADDDADTVLRRADEALYAAKGAGRDRVVGAAAVAA